MKIGALGMGGWMSPKTLNKSLTDTKIRLNFRSGCSLTDRHGATPELRGVGAEAGGTGSVIQVLGFPP